MEGIFLVVQLKEGRYLETRKTFPYKDHIERQKSSLMSYTKQRVEKKKNLEIITNTLHLLVGTFQ